MRVLLGIPSHRGWLHHICVRSLLASAEHLRAQGVRVGLEVATGSLTHVARNKLVALALAGDWSHLLFVDDDQGWVEDVPSRLLAWNEDVIVPCVPSRHSESFAVAKPRAVPDRAPLIEVLVAGAGVMLLSRRCLERVAAVYGAHPFQCAHPVADDPAGFDRPDLFVSEDFMFCHRWRGLGGRVLADPTLRTAHVGEVICSSVLDEAWRDGPVMFAGGETMTAKEAGVDV